MMKKLDLVASSLLIAGGVNWLAIGAGKYDLVGKISGKQRFGETNLASRTLYGIVGGSALWALARIVEKEIVAA